MHWEGKSSIAGLFPTKGRVRGKATREDCDEGEKYPLRQEERPTVSEVTRGGDGGERVI